jgi:ATP-dependent Lon protease
MLDTIPDPALRDRMEIIELSSYTEDEKVNIAQGYLIPRQIRRTACAPARRSFTDAALREIIQGYTREAGVRNMERRHRQDLPQDCHQGGRAGDVKRKRIDQCRTGVQYLGKKR